MTQEEAYTALVEQLRGDPNVTCVGIGKDQLVVYTVKRARPGSYPPDVGGHKVVVKRMGRISPLGGAT